MPGMRRGSIVYVELLDPQGRNPKVRPAVVLTPTADIRPDGVVEVAAVTGQTDQSPADECVPLQWEREGKASTGLRKPSVAVTSWVVPVPVVSILNARGTVPTNAMLTILHKVRERRKQIAPASDVDLPAPPVLPAPPPAG